MSKKKSFRAMSSDAIIREYKAVTLLLWLCHFLTFPAAGVLIYCGVSGRMQPMNAVMSTFFVLFLNFFIRVLRLMKLSQLSNILTLECDPIKYEAVFRGLQALGWKNPAYTLNIARALYYKGDWKDALTELKRFGIPKQKSTQIFQYYNLLASCYEMANDFDKIIETREKVKKVLSTLKEKDTQAANGRHLLTIIDGMLTFHRGNLTRAREIYLELFDNATFTLSRMTSLWKLAQLDQITGAGRSAIDRCEYIIDAGNQTFYVAEAERILALCRGRRTQKDTPESLEQLEGEVSADES